MTIFLKNRRIQKRKLNKKNEARFIHRFIPSNGKEKAGGPRKIVPTFLLLYGTG
jgi:hypothetical protein